LPLPPTPLPTHDTPPTEPHPPSLHDTLPTFRLETSLPEIDQTPPAIVAANGPTLCTDPASEIVTFTVSPLAVPAPDAPTDVLLALCIAHVCAPATAAVLTASFAGELIAGGDV